MPLFLLPVGITLIGGWLGLKLVKDAETEFLKIGIVGTVAWVAWVNRASLAKVVKL